MKNLCLTIVSGVLDSHISVEGLEGVLQRLAPSVIFADKASLEKLQQVSPSSYASAKFIVSLEVGDT